MKKVDELLQELNAKKEEMRGLLDADKIVEAKSVNEEIRSLKEKIELQKELDETEEREVENKIEKREGNIEMENREKQTGMELRAIIKASMGKSVSEEERALLVGGSNGEGYILPADVRTKIVGLIRQYKSFRDVVGYLPTTDLSGSFPVEDFETVTELVDFTDGTDGTEANDIKFRNVSFSLKEKGALIKLSNTLLKMTDNNLINYVAQVFAKKAVITENKMAITALKANKVAKAIADYKALKSSINVDIDPAMLFGTVIVTNQDAFDVLDSELDLQGRPILQPNPTNPTQKLFMGYPVVVFSNTLLPTVATKAPVFYGNLAEAVKVVDNGAYSFATSEHAGFTSNTTVARVIEYVDVIQVETSDKAYIYGEITIA